jgi:hypothetical protein
LTLVPSRIYLKNGYAKVELGLAAGENLSPWYQQLGIPYDPPRPMPEDEFRRQLEAYRQRVREHERQQ